MTSVRTTLAASLCVAALQGVAAAQTPTAVESLLNLRPVIKGIEYDVPADAPAAKACKAEPVLNAAKKAIGWALRDGQGKMLRRIVDSDGDGKTDQWGYYQDGFEVYRDSDLNNDLSPDECRWLNAAGTRIGAVSHGKITGWKRISAEEASKVFVQGLVSGDRGLIESVLATPEELASIGIPKGQTEQVAAAVAQRAEQIGALQKSLVGWNSKTVWNRLDGQMPHLIPGDASTGLPQDLLLYENAVIFAGPPNGQAPPAKMAFLQAPELIKIGEAWKFVELPRAVDPDKPLVSTEGGIRAWVFRQQAGPAGGDNPELDAALKKLADYDNANAKVQVEGGKREVAQFHVGRVPLLRAVVKICKNADEQLTYDKQVVDSLAAAYQTGVYPQGIRLLDETAKGTGKLATYAAFRKVSAEFAVRNDDPGANLMANQKTWMGDLRAFLNAFPKADEAPEALMQLASAAEFNADEDDARKFYEQLVRDFNATEPGKKAAGSLKRLDLVGKSIDLRGPGLNGQEVSATQFKGKTVLVTFWASWADPVKRDLPELLKVYQKYRGKDFEILGVNLDNERTDLDAFLKDNPLPWPQIFEPGGSEKSRFASEYGIIALPTMLLVDPQGKVVNRSIRTAAELDRQLEKLATGRTAGVALDR